MARIFTPSLPRISLTFDRAPGTLSRMMEICVIIMARAYSLTKSKPRSKAALLSFVIFDFPSPRISVR